MHEAMTCSNSTVKPYGPPFCASRIAAAWALRVLNPAFVSGAALRACDDPEYRAALYSCTRVVHALRTKPLVSSFMLQPFAVSFHCP
jgi:hypothetical protein